MIKTLTLAAMIAGTVFVSAPAYAAPIGATSGAALALADSGKDLVETVQYRRYGGYRGGYRGGSRYGYRGRGGYGRGALGAGIAAGAIGGLAAGILATQARPVYVDPDPVYVAPAYGGYAAPVYGGYGPSDTDAVAYCSRRFRSYDPSTGTYIGNGGVVRACP